MARASVSVLILGVAGLCVGASAATSQLRLQDALAADPRYRLLVNQYNSDVIRNLKLTGEDYLYAAAIKSDFGTPGVFVVEPPDCVRERTAFLLQLERRKAVLFNLRTLGPTVPVRRRVNCGVRASTVAFPFLVGLFDRSGKLDCSGVIVDRWHVLTALHCLCARDTAAYRRPANIRLGDGWSGWLESRSVAGAHVWPGSTCPFLPGMRDLALLRLAQPFERAGWAVFAPVEWLFHSRYALVAGFGLDSRNRTGRLNVINVALLTSFCDPARRLPVNPPHRYVTSDTYLFGCAGGVETVAVPPRTPHAGKGGADTCTGDSGGALMIFAETIRDGAKRNRRRVGPVLPPQLARGTVLPVFVTGITSRAAGWVPSGRPCGFGGIYSVVNLKVIRWMRAAGANVRLSGKPGTVGYAKH